MGTSTACNGSTVSRPSPDPQAAASSCQVQSSGVRPHAPRDRRRGARGAAVGHRFRRHAAADAAGRGVLRAARDRPLLASVRRAREWLPGGYASLTRVYALERGAQDACAGTLPRTCAHPYPPWPETHGNGASSWGRERPVGRRSGTTWSGPRWIALPIPMPSSWWRPAPGDFVNLAPPAAIDETCWPEQARFSPGAIGTRERFDAFFVPLDSFSGAIRPGPEVIVRRRVCGNLAGTRTR